MKTDVHIYKPPDGDKGKGYPRIPKAFEPLRNWFLNEVTSYMRYFGIKRISIRPNMVGLRTMAEMTFKPLDDNPPPEFMAARSFIVRNIADRMLMFGVLDVGIEPTDKEMKILRKDWSDLIEGKVNEDINLKEIKLNLEEDPTAQNVLPERPADGVIPTVTEETSDGKPEPDGNPIPAAS